MALLGTILGYFSISFLQGICYLDLQACLFFKTSLRKTVVANICIATVIGLHSFTTGIVDAAFRMLLLILCIMSVVFFFLSLNPNP